MPERRLIDEGASALEREVLAAWEDEKAPRATRVRATRLAVEAAGLAVVVAGTAHGAAGLGAKGLGWSFSWLAKGLAMALFVGFHFQQFLVGFAIAPDFNNRLNW